MPTATATLVPTATPLAVQIVGYGRDAFDAATVALLAVSMLGFALVFLVLVLILLRRAV